MCGCTKYGQRRLNNLRRLKSLGKINVNVNVDKQTQKFAQNVALTVAGGMIVSSLINLAGKK
jgi:hypothetical protein